VPTAVQSADLAFAGPSSQAELLRDGQVSSRELVELYLERIERLQPELNCFSKVMTERALTDADQADARRRADDDRPLLGVPIAVKEMHDVAGEVTTCGTGAHENRRADRDGDLVSLLRAAGAVIVGKTTTPELAIIGDTEGPSFGITRNPWNPDRSVAGSSGGSGAAVAAGLCAAATASDGAGSIRNPAAWCGLFGLKPQRDRISLAPDDDHWHGLSVNGFLTRTVRDTALLVDLTAQTPTSRPLVEAARIAPGPLRIGVTTRSPWPFPLSGEMKKHLDGAAQLLRSLGHSVEPADPPYGMLSQAVNVRFLRGASDDARNMPRPERLARRTRGFARLGRLFPDAALRWAVREGERMAQRVEPLFRDHHALLTPVSTRAQVRAGQWEGMSAPRTALEMNMVFPYQVAWNMTGQPAVSVPMASTDDGMPVGMQLVGRPNDEPTLISLAAQLESELHWPDRRPPLA
jgi:amidase